MSSFTLTCFPHFRYDAKNCRPWIKKDRQDPWNSQTIDCFFDPLTTLTLSQLVGHIEDQFTKLQPQYVGSRWFAGNHWITITIVLRFVEKPTMVRIWNTVTPS